MSLQEKAGQVAAGTTTLAAAMGTASTSEACGLAILAGRPDLVPAPWTGNLGGAWRRLDRHQQAALLRLAPAAAEEARAAAQADRRQA